MRCTEKEILQQKWTAAWNAYEAVVNESGLSIDPISKSVKPPSISELVAARLA
jgi:hypothetical protein